MNRKGIVGLIIVLLVFGSYAVPKILNRLNPEQLVFIGKAPAFSLPNQNGKLIANNAFEGKVYLVSFFFSTCPTICPIMNANMYKVQHEFLGNPNFGIASISINPKNDTPAVLKEYAKKIGVTSKSWYFLTGDQKTIYSLANKGFALYATENNAVAGGFEHSGMFALIDKKGNIRSRKDAHGNPIAFYDGLDNKSIRALKRDIQLLLQE
jgi:protein SCO1/2